MLLSAAFHFTANTLAATAAAIGTTITALSGTLAARATSLSLRHETSLGVFNGHTTAAALAARTHFHAAASATVGTSITAFSGALATVAASLDIRQGTIAGLRGTCTAAAASAAIYNLDAILAAAIASTTTAPTRCATARLVATASRARGSTDARPLAAAAAFLFRCQKPLFGITSTGSTAAAFAFSISSLRRIEAELNDTEHRDGNANRQYPERSKDNQNQQECENHHVHSFHESQGLFEVLSSATHESQSVTRDWRNAANRLTEIIFHLSLDCRIAVDSLQNTQAQLTLGTLGAHAARQEDQQKAERGNVNPHHANEQILAVFQLRFQNKGRL